MTARRFMHIHEQVADFLRTELISGRWVEVMPGRNHLVKLLEVSGKTVDLALQQLESEGLLVAQGVGKKRRIALPCTEIKAPAMRIRIMLYEQSDLTTDHNAELKYRLELAGHEVAFARKSLQDLGMNPERVARYVSKSPADAWVVFAGSREVLEWFADQSIKVFALFGRRSGLPIAGCSPRKIPALEEAVDELVALGHRRIVMIVREERIKPFPALAEEMFLQFLAKHGIEPSSYNLPEWKDDMRSFHRCLDGLFKLTPPTALIVNEAQLFVPALQHMGRLGIKVPEQLSMICDDPDKIFQWCDPPISHIRWEMAPLIRRVVKWANNLAQGKTDIKQSTSRAQFVRGGTIGPASGFTVG